MNCFEKDGVFVTTERLDGENAVIRVQYETLGCDEAEFVVEDAGGRTVVFKGEESEKGEVELTVPCANLWNPDSPYMYTLRCHAFTECRITDVIRIPFGIRTIRFDADEGFFLNGENMKIKGVCVHHN